VARAATATAATAAIVARAATISSKLKREG
jgi:hypothetical protein